MGRDGKVDVHLVEVALARLERGDAGHGTVRGARGGGAGGGDALRARARGSARRKKAEEGRGWREMVATMGG